VSAYFPQAQKRVDENGDPIESDEEDEEVKEVVPDKKKNTRLCSECSSRVAIRACVECGDKFCTKCYKHLHSTGELECAFNKSCVFPMLSVHVDELCIMTTNFHLMVHNL
jgi:hypothetical protein